MKLGELIEEVRGVVDDAVEPYLWGDPRIKFLLNEAEREACIRMSAKNTPLLVDRSTADLAVLTVSAAAMWIALDGRVLSVTSAAWDGNDLDITSESELEYYYGSSWKIHTGTPVALLVKDGHVRPFPIPAEGGTLTLTTPRLPLDDMATVDSDSPEISTLHHRKLVDYVAKVLFMDNNADKYDPDIARRHEDAFARNFGPPVAANVTQGHLTQNPRRAKFPRA